MKTTYRAMQAVRPGVLELVELAVPEPGPDQVRIRVEACGICHSDALTVEGGFPGLAHPRVPGHEVIGRIDAVGPAVATWKVGQRVGVGFFAGPCHACERCRRGDYVNCRAQPMHGIQLDGGYAEVMLAKASGLAAIPEEIAATDAAPLLCAGVTTFNALRNSAARAGDLIAIQGLGGLGHLGVQYARSMGFRVAAIARGAAKRPLAVELGAHHYVDSDADDVAVELQRLGGARVIVATAANSESMSILLGGLAERGELIVAGVGGRAPIALDPVKVLFGERRVAGTLTGHPIDSEDTLAFSLLQGIRPRVEVAPLVEAPAAYQRMMANAARFRIVLSMA